MDGRLFGPEVLDRLEGLSERYALLSRRIEELQNEAAAFDRVPDPAQLATFERLRREVRGEAIEVLKGLVEGLEPS